MENEPFSSDRDPHGAQPPPSEPPAAMTAELLEEDEWIEEPVEGAAAMETVEELPRRPRRRLLAPLPVALVVVLAVACGFIGGVLVEKGETSSSSTPSTGGSLAAAARGGGRGRLAAGLAGGPAAGAGGGATVGQVAFVSGSTLYVTDSEGNTLRVITSRASTVTKSVKSSVAGIHPGETVLVTGAKAANGAINAESIRTGESLGGGGLSSLFGGGSGLGSSGRSGNSGGAPAGGEPALFGKGG